MLCVRLEQHSLLDLWVMSPLRKLARDKLGVCAREGAGNPVWIRIPTGHT